jgi:hypothetical protein
LDRHAPSVEAVWRGRLVRKLTLDPTRDYQSQE